MSSTLAKERTAFAAAIERAKQHIDAMRDRIRDLRQAVQNARAAYVPRAELAERIRSQVRADGEWWRKQHGGIVLARLAKPRGFTRVNMPWAADAGVPWGLLCAAAPDQAEALLTGAVAGQAYEAGPSAAERPALIERLERELAALERDEEAAVDEAEAAGVAIGHRPEVIDRRQMAALQQRNDEHRIAEARARQEALERVYEQRQRAQPSRYLAEANRPVV
jgi:hypothetical protein